MKLIIKEFLAGLKERNELDAIIPDLLSEMGLHVFSKPKRGISEFGVDVAAYGKIDDEEDTVYLLSIKPGDLTRTEWAKQDPSEIQPSLIEAKTTYVVNRLPTKYRDSKVKICLCFGGNIHNDVRDYITAFEKQHETDRISFEQWDGDIIAGFIQYHLLNDRLLDSEKRSHLQKSLALIDDPEACYKHFRSLLDSLIDRDFKRKKEKLFTLRQINIATYILFSWSRDAENLEGSYLSSELSILYGWELIKNDYGKKGSLNKQLLSSFRSILNIYFMSSGELIENKILPYVSVQYGLTTATRGQDYVQSNLKLFDYLGRIGLYVIFVHWHLSVGKELDNDLKLKLENKVIDINNRIVQFIKNNPILFLPVSENQTVDLGLVLVALSLDIDKSDFLKGWLNQITQRWYYSVGTSNKYPCMLSDYQELLDHPVDSDEYFQDVTKGSTLLPLIATWAAFLEDSITYKNVQEIHDKFYQHSNFQAWYIGDDSEENIYLNSDLHGATLSHAWLQKPPNEFLKMLFDECDELNHYNSLSAVEAGFYPLVLVACRHFKLPVPVDFNKWMSDVWSVEINEEVE